MNAVDPIAPNLYRYHLATSADLAAQPIADDVLILPVAAPENHGPHLPLGTDALVSDELSLRLARRLAAAYPHSRIWLHPAWQLGAATIRGVGSVKTPYRVFRRALYGYLRRFVKQGFRRFIVISGHGGVPHVGAMDDVCTRLRRLRVGGMPVQAIAPAALAAGKAFAGEYADRLRDAGIPLSDEEVNDLAEDLHGGRMETAMMLAIAPDQVREIYRTLPDIRPPQRWWLRAIENGLRKIIKRLVKSPETYRRVAFSLRIGVADLSWIIRGRREGYIGWPSKATAAEGNALLDILADDIALLSGRVFSGELDPRRLRSAAYLFRWFLLGCGGGLALLAGLVWLFAR